MKDFLELQPLSKPQASKSITIAKGGNLTGCSRGSWCDGFRPSGGFTEEYRHGRDRHQKVSGSGIVQGMQLANK